MALRGFYTMYQSKSSSCDKYFETITNLREFIYHCGGFIGNNPLLIDMLLKVANPEDPGNLTDNKKALTKSSTKEAYMAT